MSKEVPIGADEKPPPYTPNPSYYFNPNNQNYVPPPPPPGFQPYPPQTAPGPVTSYGSVPAHTQHVVITTQPADNIIIVGGCPACRIGVLEDDFTCLGICCAIFFFPLGVLCCLALKDKRCTNCGAYFG